MHACVVTDPIDIRATGDNAHEHPYGMHACMYALQLANTPCFTSKHQRRSSLAGLLIENILVHESTGF